MINEYLLFVPGDYAFGNYFLPKIKNQTIDFFEVSHKRRGIQRKGNNHLVVFLEFVCKRAPAEYPWCWMGKPGR